jgi:hypothetical protein
MSRWFVDAERANHSRGGVEETVKTGMVYPRLLAVDSGNFFSPKISSSCADRTLASFNRVSSLVWVGAMIVVINILE